MLQAPTTASQRDQLWSDGTVTVLNAPARFAGLTQQFGWYNGHSGASSFNQIGTSVNTGLQNTVLGSNLNFTGRNCRWGRRNVGESSPHSSRVDDNDAQAGDDFVCDHMITYYVTGVGDRARWILFWEDRNTAGADRDYSDLVIELIAVPVPGAALLGVLGLGVMGWVKRRPA